MPDNYQAILDDLGVSSDNQTETTTEAQETTSNVDTATADNTETKTETETETTVTDNNEGDEPAKAKPELDESQRRANEAFAAMRTENAKYKKFMQQMMKGANYAGSEDDFIEKLTDAAYQRQAQQQGNQVNPELLKRVDALESQNKSLTEARNREMFSANIANLQRTFDLKDNDIKEFVDLAVREHIDLTVPGTNFVTLYQGLFFNKLMDKKINEERQKWIAQSSKANNAANPDGKSGKKDPSPTNVNTMAEFDSLLQSIPTNK